MPYARPSLSELRHQVAQDIAAALPGHDPLLRFSYLQIVGAVEAGLAHLHYGYIDWISQQATPFTATGEFLEAWPALKGIYRLPATSASGSVRFNGTDGSVLPVGQQLVRGDGKTYTTTSAGTVAGGTVTVTASADPDPSGLTGAFGNCDAGSLLTLGQAIGGIQSNGAATVAFVGGADLEGDDSLRARTLFAFQNPAHGGDADDYVTWARQVPGVTRAWCVPHGFGGGTVVVFVMFDAAEAAHGGFPQGTDGCASAETRDRPATGDQLTVANYLYPLQQVTALVYVLSPIVNSVSFTIDGIAGVSAATKASIADAISAVFLARSSIAAAETTVPLSYIESAIAALPGTAGFVITSPVSNIVSATGQLAVLGSVSYT